MAKFKGLTMFDPVLCERLDNALLVRHTTYDPSTEPELYVVEQCVTKKLGFPDTAKLAAGLTSCPEWLRYWATYE